MKSSPESWIEYLLFTAETDYKVSIASSYQ
jgi:hypothetical protein